MRGQTTLIIVLTGGLAVSQGASAGEVSIDRNLIAKGVTLYQENCSVCHGENGDGAGPLASGFSSAPRNLTTGIFKLRSTGIGQFPTKDDLTRTIQNGITGSYGASMPGFAEFSQQDLDALIEVIRYLAGIDEFGIAIAVPPRPETADVERGQALYARLNCVSCHGAEGNGQGDLAPNLKDATGNQIRPADFRVGNFKGGNTPEDVWMRIYTGLAGTPMPAFGNNNPPEDIWALTEYILKFKNQE